MQEILLVEDSDEDAQLLRLALKRAGIANPVRHLFDGVTAGILLREIDRVGSLSPLLPGVLVIDLKLPGMSGFDLLELTQKSHAFGGTLRIVLSQLDDTRSIKRAYTLGARSFLIRLNRADNRLPGILEIWRELSPCPLPRFRLLARFGRGNQRKPCGAVRMVHEAGAAEFHAESQSRWLRPIRTPASKPTIKDIPTAS
jgi:two-component system response regulator